MQDSENLNVNIDDFIQEVAEVAEPLPKRRRVRRTAAVPAVNDDDDAKKRMLQALEKYTYIWQVPVGRRGRQPTNPIEWNEIAKEATGDTNDVPKMKDWYLKAKKSIRYRLDQAIKKGNLCREALEANGEAALNALYDRHNYQFWPNVEYLTKYYIYQHPDLNVDIDKIYSQPEEEFYDDQVPSPSDAAAAQNEYNNEQQRDVPGFQQPLPWHQLPPFPRVSQVGAPRVDGDSQSVLGQSFEQRTSEQTFGIGNNNGGGDSMGSVIVNIKHEIYSHTGDQTEYNSTSSTFSLRNVKREIIDDDEDDGKLGERFCPRHPLEYLDPIHKSKNYPPPQPTKFEITQDELDGRIRLFNIFKAFIMNNVQFKSIEEIHKFLRQFIRVCSPVSAMASLNLTFESIAKAVDNTLKHV